MIKMSRTLMLRLLNLSMLHLQWFEVGWRNSPCGLMDAMPPVAGIDKLAPQALSLRRVFVGNEPRVFYKIDAHSAILIHCYAINGFFAVRILSSIVLTGLKASLAANALKK
ncbi:MAG: hypothetical protein PHG47_01540 [Sulfuricella sp.]|nr:hypothetical protein [Sulfuricella sp.]